MIQQTTASLEESPAALLYERHAAPILAYLRLHAPTWEDAQDVLHEVFLATMEQRQLLNLSEREQLAWLVRVAQRKIADHYRRTQQRGALSLEHVADKIEANDTLAPEQVILRREEQQALHEMLGHLTVLQQRVLYLRFVGGLHCPQIASLLGKREEAVRQVLSRTIKQLRSLYEK